MNPTYQQLLDMVQKRKPAATPEEQEANDANDEAILDAAFDRLVNPTAYDSHQLLGEELSAGISGAGAHIGEGIAKAGFYLGIAAVVVAAIVKYA